MKNTAKTFRLQVTLDTGGDEATATAGFALRKSDPAKVKPSVTLKASGAIDTIRPATAITLTPTLKNYYGELSVKDLKFKILEGKEDVTGDYLDRIPFNCEYRNGVFVLTRNLDHENPLPLGYLKVQAYLSVDYKDANDKDQNFASKPVALSVKTGSAKITANVKSVTLLKNDDFSTATIKLSRPAGVSEIYGVYVDSPYYMAHYLGGGEVLIRYAKGSAGVKAGTIKLQVTLEGSQKSKPDAEIAIKVNLA